LIADRHVGVTLHLSRRSGRALPHAAAPQGSDFQTATGAIRPGPLRLSISICPPERVDVLRWSASLTVSPHLSRSELRITLIVDAHSISDNVHSGWPISTKATREMRRFALASAARLLGSSVWDVAQARVQV
jgi:hypothetical protein